MKKKFLIMIPIFIVLLGFIIVYTFFNFRDNSTNLTILEKKWISDNLSNKVDIEVVSDLLVYSNSGTGVIFDLLERFSNDTKLEFNKIPYSKLTNPKGNGLRFKIVNNDYVLTKNDILISDDGYVVLSTSKDRYDDVNFLNKKNIGVFASDVGEISYYLKDRENINYKNYENIDEMLLALNGNVVNMIIIPQTMYLDKIMGRDNLHINYYFTEISNKLIISLSEKENEQKLNEILKKYYANWKKNNFISSYNKHYLNSYVTLNKINDKTKADMLSRNYVYGYVENYPYEVNINNSINGVAGEYIERLKRLTNLDITYKKYKNLNELKNAIKNKELDIYFNYFDSEESGYLKTISTFDEKYVVISNLKESINVSSFEGLKNVNVNMIDDNALHNYFKNNSKAIIKLYDNLDKLKVDNNLIVIDREVYEYYKNTKFSNYYVLYTGSIANDYNFLVKDTNNDIYKLFNYLISTNSFYNYRMHGINSLNLSIVDRTSFEELYLIVLGILILPVLIVIAIVLFFKKKKKINEVRKEDRRMYTDILTSLKNRNYLNLNMETWENSKVFPQAVVIIDLNNVKYVNDNYGHEAGDQLIVKAAGILINTQLENTEIIRTNGNEFLVYLVGYTDKQVETYCKKLTKTFKQLPHEFGASVGFSMIVDDIKTLDDAITEATQDMRKKKQEK